MLTRSETELTTAATDLLLGLVGLWLTWRLSVLPVQAAWPQQIWIGTLVLLSASALLGSVVHGIELHGTVRSLLWKPLYLCLGLTVGFLVVCAVSDWLGEGAGRHTLPWTMAAGVAFFVLTQVRRGGFAIFLVYEAAATLFALGVYTALAFHDRPGAVPIAAGLALTLIGAAVQAGRFSMHVVVRFDHNGLFHLVQLIGVVIIAAGVRMSLLTR